jgi:hypothetical protein
MTNPLSIGNLREVTLDPEIVELIENFAGTADIGATQTTSSTIVGG